MTDYNYASLFVQVFGGTVLHLIDQVYRSLPLGTIIDGRVLVVHGGISETTDLKLISDIDRHKVRRTYYVYPPTPIYTFMHTRFKSFFILNISSTIIIMRTHERSLRHP